MAGSFRYPLIVAGTCAILALAAVGCTSTPNNAPAASQTEVENVEASVTERGQSEQEDLDVAAEAGETDTEDVNGYADKTFRVAFELPEGFEAHHLDSEYEDERVAFFCCTEDGQSEASFTTCSDVRKFADVTDEKSWAEAFASTYVKGMEKAGETAIQKATGTVKFSDYIGKGKYILVDFWASWCGPCIREIPNIKDVYATYGGDKFDILSVAVWDKLEDTKRAAEELELPWNQIVNAQQIPTDLYGIDGIPHIILFGPDGTILKRELRGPAIAAEIAKYVSAN